MSERKQVKIMTGVYAGAIFFLGVLVLLGILIYGFSVKNRLTQKGSQIFPYPAAVIGGVNFITIRNLDKNVSAVRKFYEEQNFSSVGLSVDFTSADGQKRLAIKKRDALTKMIEDRIIEILANKRGIVLTQAAVAEEVQKRAAEFGDQQALAENIQRLYGWNVADFEAKIVKPELYKALLIADLQEKEAIYTQAKTKIEEAKTALAGGMDFGEVAKKYSEGESAGSGGELGWFSADQMLPEIAIVAYSMKEGESSKVIQSSLGFHILQVKNKKSEEGINKLQLKQVLVRTPSLADWLLEQEKNIKIYIPLKGLFWNNNDGMVEFNDEALQKFETELDSNSADDASMLF